MLKKSYEPPLLKSFENTKQNNVKQVGLFQSPSKKQHWMQQYSPKLKSNGDIGPPSSYKTPTAMMTQFKMINGENNG